jgi:hypothetical protein
MSALEWFAVIAGGASVASLPVALVLGWFGKRTSVDIHAATQLTLTDLRKGFSESQERLGQILTQMDQHWREAFERMDQRADERHREVIDAIQALRR